MTQHTPKQECTVQTLDTHLMYSARKVFLGSFTPLTAPGRPIPQPSDLTDWWSTVELALRAIHKTVEPTTLSTKAIDLLGPLILGPAGWSMIAKPGLGLGWNGMALCHTPSGGTLQRSWSEFRASVETTFGLTAAQKKKRFFALQRRFSESCP